jgi:hypothetical protein
MHGVQAAAQRTQMRADNARVVVAQQDAALNGPAVAALGRVAKVRGALTTL